MSGFPYPPTVTPPAIPAVPSHWTFPADPASVARARRAVTGALPQRCRPHLSDDLRLLASELVTNAVRYGPHPADDHVIDLVLWPADGHYWLAVSDAGTDSLPTLASPTPDTCRGRGLLLVDALSATWAVVPRPTCAHPSSPAYPSTAPDPVFCGNGVPGVHPTGQDPTYRRFVR